MARAYSLDLRERVVAAVAAGESCRAVATKFKVSVASVVKWSQRFRATGSAAAYKVGGRRPYPLAGERDWLLIVTQGNGVGQGYFFRPHTAAGAGQPIARLTGSESGLDGRQSSME